MGWDQLGLMTLGFGVPGLGMHAVQVQMDKADNRRFEKIFESAREKAQRGETVSREDFGEFGTAVKPEVIDGLNRAASMVVEGMVVRGADGGFRLPDGSAITPALFAPPVVEGQVVRPGRDLGNSQSPIANRGEDQSGRTEAAGEPSAATPGPGVLPETKPPEVQAAEAGIVELQKPRFAPNALNPKAAPVQIPLSSQERKQLAVHQRTISDWQKDQARAVQKAEGERVRLAAKQAAEEQKRQAKAAEDQQVRATEMAERIRKAQGELSPIEQADYDAWLQSVVKDERNWTRAAGKNEWMRERALGHNPSTGRVDAEYADVEMMGGSPVVLDVARSRLPVAAQGLPEGEQRRKLAQRASDLLAPKARKAEGAAEFLRGRGGISVLAPDGSRNLGADEVLNAVGINTREITRQAASPADAIRRLEKALKELGGGLVVMRGGMSPAAASELLVEDGFLKAEQREDINALVGVISGDARGEEQLREGEVAEESAVWTGEDLGKTRRDPESGAPVRVIEAKDLKPGRHYLVGVGKNSQSGWFTVEPTGKSVLLRSADGDLRLRNTALVGAEVEVENRESGKAGKRETKTPLATVGSATGDALDRARVQAEERQKAALRQAQDDAAKAASEEKRKAAEDLQRAEEEKKALAERQKEEEAAWKKEEDLRWLEENAFRPPSTGRVASSRNAEEGGADLTPAEFLDVLQRAGFSVKRGGNTLRAMLGALKKAMPEAFGKLRVVVLDGEGWAEFAKANPHTRKSPMLRLMTPEGQAYILVNATEARKLTGMHLSMGLLEELGHFVESAFSGDSRFMAELGGAWDSLSEGERKAFEAAYLSGYAKAGVKITMTPEQIRTEWFAQQVIAWARGKKPLARQISERKGLMGAIRDFFRQFAGVLKVARSEEDYATGEGLPYNDVKVSPQMQATLERVLGRPAEVEGTQEDGGRRTEDGGSDKLASARAAFRAKLDRQRGGVAAMSPAWLRSSGVQSPKENTTPGSGRTVLTEVDVVKSEERRGLRQPATAPTPDGSTGVGPHQQAFQGEPTKGGGNVKRGGPNLAAMAPVHPWIGKAFRDVLGKIEEQGKPRFLALGDAGFLERVAEEIRGFGNEVRGADNSGITIPTPERGSLGSRAWHLIRDEQTGRIHPGKVRWLPNVVTTLQGADVRLKDVARGTEILAKKYVGGGIHLVVVSPNGEVRAQEGFDGRLQTQFPLAPKDSRRGDPRQLNLAVDWVNPGIDKGGKRGPDTPLPPRRGSTAPEPHPSKDAGNVGERGKNVKGGSDLASMAPVAELNPLADRETKLAALEYVEALVASGVTDPKAFAAEVSEGLGVDSPKFLSILWSLARSSSANLPEMPQARWEQLLKNGEKAEKRESGKLESDSEEIPLVGNPDLTVTGQGRELPGQPRLQYVVHFATGANKNFGKYVVTITKSGESFGYALAPVRGYGDTAEAAYRRAVDELKPEHQPKASTSAADRAVVVDKAPPGGWTDADKVAPVQNFETFAKAYREAFRSMLKYGVDQVGSGVFLEKMAKMSDEHPDWVARIEAEEEAAKKSPAPDLGTYLDAVRTRGVIYISDSDSVKVLESDSHPGKFFVWRTSDGTRSLLTPLSVPPMGMFEAQEFAAREALKIAMDGKGSETPPVNIEPKKGREAPGSSLDVTKILADTPSARAANTLMLRLAAGKSLSWQELFSVCDEAWGGTQAEGKYTVKDAYDAMEMAVNRLIEANPRRFSPVVDGDGARKAIADLETLLPRLVTQSKRTAEMDEFQQFSTPPPLAFAVAWLANLRPGDTVLEPSAGVGGIATFAKVAGARRVVVNELSARRRALLEALGFDKVYGENAEQIHNVLPLEEKPTVVVMNPPFSSTAGRMQGVRDTKNAKKHLGQALQRLEPGGRLVAIFGEGMAADRATFKDFWRNEVGTRYTVRAIVQVSGKNYAKYGTTWDNVVVVIDKVAPKAHAPITGQVETLDELITKLEGVRNERPTQTSASGSRTGLEPASPQRGGAPLAGEGRVGGDQLPGRDVRAGAGAVGAGQEGDAVSPRPGPRGDVPVSGQAELPLGPASGHGATDDHGSGRPGAAGRGAFAGGEPGGRGGAGVGTDPQRGGEPAGASTVVAPGVSPGYSDQARKADAPLDAKVFELYQPQITIPGAQQHASPLAESAAMASVKYPAVRYEPNLPEHLVKQGKLSGPQMEAVILSGAAHQQMLPNGTRRGFFIGDGTGVGKGRESAAVILDNWNQGRRKAVWVSQNGRLISSAQRDLADLGGDPKWLIPVDKVKAGGEIKASKGIAFIAYTMLSSGEKLASEEKNKVSEAGTAKKVAKSRVDQLVEWLGKDFDGVIVFDEAHGMANATVTKGERGKKDASLMALAGLDLQKRLPNARVVYSSATGATEVSNLAYAERLGLWGEGTPFANVQAFIEQIGEGGVAAMEKVSADMKALGLYIARTLDMSGVEYEQLVHDLTPKQTAMYNELAKAWQVVLRNINSALEVTGVMQEGKAVGGGSGRAKSAAMSAFWGANQRFWNQVLTSLQMPSVLASIKADIDRGESVVVQLVSTFEASQERAASKAADEGTDLEDLDITPRDALMQMVERSFPVIQYETSLDDKGNAVISMVKDSKGNPVQNREAVAMRDALLSRIASLSVPQGALDMLIDEFGHEKVAEVTGRGRRLIWKETDKGRERVWQDLGKSAREGDIAAFQGDQKQILAFSDAGGTGASYHADRRAKNQRKRNHYLLQPGWRADKAVQGLGRSHRSNQKQPPLIRTVSTNLEGQKRFVSSIARRLDQLGALTKGQRQTASQGVFKPLDNLESSYAKEALGSLYGAICSGKVEGMGPEQFTQETGIKLLDDNGQQAWKAIIPTFLNRLLSLEVDRQKVVFGYFFSRLEAFVAKAMEDGTLDAGLETIQALHTVTTREETVYTEPRSGAETKYVKLELTHPTTLTPWKVAHARATAKDAGGFVVNIKSGAIWAVGEIHKRISADGNRMDYFPLYGVRGRQQVEAPRLTEEHYRKVEASEAEGLWVEATEKAPKTWTEEMNLITGAILPIWNRIKGNQRIVRVQTDDGRRMVGRVVPEAMIGGVLKALGAERDPMRVSPAQAVERVTQRGQTLQLANDWKIKPSRLSGEIRMEVIGPEYDNHAELEKAGVVLERVQFKMRYFIPTGEFAEPAMKKVLDNRPVVDVSGGKGGSLSEEGAAYKASAAPEGEKKIDTEAPGGTLPGDEGESSKFRGDRGGFEEAASAYAGGSGHSDQGGPGVSGEERLQAWAANRGMLQDTRAFQSLPVVSESGGEHDVRFRASDDRAITEESPQILRDAPVTREAVTAFATAQGVPDPAAASRQIEMDLGAMSAPELKKSYPENRESGKAGKRETPEGRIDQARADANALAEAARSGEGQPEAFRAEVVENVREALARGKGRISTIIHELVNRDVMKFDIRGAVIESPEDFAKLLWAVRSPYVETLKVVFVDSKSRVVHSEVVSVGLTNQTLIHANQILRAIPSLKGTAKITGVILSHNHPSGNPKPSADDIRVTRELAQACHLAGLTLLDHVITNGKKFTSLKSMGVIDVQGPTPKGIMPSARPSPGEVPKYLPIPDNPDLAPWEAIARGEAPMMNRPESLNVLAAVLAKANPHADYGIYLDAQLQMVGMEQLPHGLSSKEITARLGAGASHEGGVHVLLWLADEGKGTASERSPVKVDKINPYLVEWLKKTEESGVAWPYDASALLAAIRNTSEGDTLRKAAQEMLDGYWGDRRQITGDEREQMLLELSQIWKTKQLGVEQWEKWNKGGPSQSLKEGSSSLPGMRTSSDTIRMAREVAEGMRVFEIPLVDVGSPSHFSLKHVVGEDAPSALRGSEEPGTYKASAAPSGDSDLQGLASDVLAKRAKVVDGKMPSGVAKMDIRERREWADKLLRSISVKNLDTGWTIKPSKAGRAKIPHEATTDADWAAITRTGELLREAVKVKSRPSREPNENLRKVHIFVAPFSYAGQLHLAKMTVFETSQGEMLYAQSLTETVEPAAIGPIMSTRTPDMSGSAGSTVTVGDLLRGVKPGEVSTPPVKLAAAPSGDLSPMAPVEEPAVEEGDGLGEKDLALAEKSPTAETVLGDLLGETVPSAKKRALVGRLFFESATKTLRHGGGVLADLASKVDQYKDEYADLVGQMTKRFNDVLRPLGFTRNLPYAPAWRARQAVFKEVSNWVEARESGQQDRAAELFEGLSPMARGIAEAMKGLFAWTSEVNRQLGIHVRDPKAKGVWRSIGSFGENYWPRVLKEDYRKVLTDPRSDPVLYERLATALMTQTGISDPTRLRQFIHLAMGLETENSFFGNLEMARIGNLPADFYEYDLAEVLPSFITSWAKRIAQIHAFGQAVPGVTKDAFQTAIEGGTLDKRAQDYVLSVRNVVYERERRGEVHNLMLALRTWMAATRLSNPLTSIRNTATVWINTIPEFGVMHTLPNLVSLRRSGAQIRNAEDAGILRADLIAGMAEATDFSKWGRRIADAALWVGGFTPVEMWSRSTASATGLQWARWAIRKLEAHPQSRAAVISLGKFRRFGVDWKNLRDEFAAGEQGHEVRKLMRAAVNSTQFSYDLRQVPLWMEHPNAKFLFQFQKWGVQQLGRVVESAFAPAFFGYRKDGSVAEKLFEPDAVHDLRPLLMWLAMTVGSGAGVLWLREFLFRKKRGDATAEELANTWRDGKKARAAALVFQRLFHDATYAGGFGIVGEWASNIENVTHLRAKSPIDPPGLAPLKNIWNNLALRGLQQGRLTWDDVYEFTWNEFPMINYGAATAKEVALKMGVEWKAAHLQEARATMREIRLLGERWAVEMGEDVGGGGGAFRRNANTPDFNDMQEALLIGDFEAADKARERFMEHETASGEEDRVALRKLRASVHGRQPVKVGGLAKEISRGDFEEWLGKRVPSMLPKLMELEDRYRETAREAGVW
jgi:predicted RNA methylase